MKYLILFLVGCLFSTSLYAECPVVSHEAEELVSEHVEKVKGSEYCKYRKSLKGQGVELVIYGVEGPCFHNGGQSGSCGNHYFFSMVGVVNGIKYNPILVGGKGLFHPKNIFYNEGLITVKGFSYAKKDPACCPSIGSQNQYEIGVSGFEKI